MVIQHSRISILWFGELVAYTYTYKFVYNCTNFTEGLHHWGFHTESYQINLFENAQSYSAYTESIWLDLFECLWHIKILCGWKDCLCCCFIGINDNIFLWISRFDFYMPQGAAKSDHTCLISCTKGLNERFLARISKKSTPDFFPKVRILLLLLNPYGSEV